jgi:hypothetical protein
MLLGLFLSTSFYAQTGGGTSPYSRSGLGDISGQHLMYLRHMGGLGAAYADINHINVANPASLSLLRSTAFDVGISAKYSNLKDEQNSQNIWSGNLEYLALAFPLSNPINEVLERKVRKYAFGMGFYLLPFSQVGYNISSTEDDPNFGLHERNFEGSGGTYKALWGNSVKYKNFSFGLNMGLVFGKIEYERNVFFNELNNAFRDHFTNDYSISGFTYNLGLMYNLRLNEDEVKNVRGTQLKYLQFGLHGKTKTSFSTNSSLLYESLFLEGNSGALATDTLQFAEGLKGSGKLPAELSFGAVYQNGNKLTLGVNFDMGFWSGYENDANPDELNDSYKVSFGGYYRPNYKSFNKYFQRVYYRFGAYYGNDPRSAEGDQLDVMGLHFGLGMPFVYQRKISHINLGFEFGLRGTNAPIQEKFLKITAGFTFNDDEWFIQRKYN